MQIERQDEMGGSANGGLRALEAGLGRLFRKSNGKTNGATQSVFEGWHPACNISETDAGYRIEVELPATNKQDLRVTVSGATLSICGERSRRPEAKHARRLLAESAYGTFGRDLELPDDADPASVEASLSEGMLVLTVARASSHAPPAGREVEIH